MPPSERKAFPADLPEGLKPRLRLFLSVDMVGSTPLKQSQQAWRPSILNFYRDFDHAVYSAYRGFNERSNRILPAPEFWKSNGDELLYTCDLLTLDQVHDTINVWLSALHTYRESMETITIRAERLDVKSTAWIGLFPAPNAEVFFRRGGAQFRADLLDDAQLLQSELRDEWYANRNHHDITRDFVGPSIDTGFRLTSWATPRRFIISVDLAFLLTSSYAEVAEPLPLHVSGRHKLKGIIDDEPYPMIWIPVGGAAKPADPSVGRDIADPTVVRAYCEAIIEQHYKFITPLFLSDTHSEDFDWAPPYIINEILRQWSDEVRYKAQAETSLEHVFGGRRPGRARMRGAARA
ncbi:MAG: hypothetical protein JWQ29_3384 [Phenylobacterium sp.]|nr:hypothetical protein [Phenylobacterium sp.]